jgi:hypothetical protein
MLGPRTKMRPIRQNAVALVPHLECVVGQDVAAQHEGPRTPLIRCGGDCAPFMLKLEAVHGVGPRARALRRKAQRQRRLRHAVAWRESIGIEAVRSKPFYKPCQHIGPDHVAADAGATPA